MITLANLADTGEKIVNQFGNVYGGENLLHKMFTIAPGFEWVIPIPFYFMEILIFLIIIKLKHFTHPSSRLKPIYVTMIYLIH